jgi:hypothetical protein
VPIGIAKVEAESATRPSDAALDSDVVRTQMIRPSCFVFASDRESQVRGAFAVVGRDDAAGNRDGLGCSVLHEEQEDLPAGNIERAEAVVCRELVETEDPLVEIDGTGELIDVERGFEDAANSGHRFASMVQSKPRRKVECHGAAPSHVLDTIPDD